MNVSLILVMSQGMAETEDKEFPVKPDIFHLKQTQKQKLLRNCILAMKINPLSNKRNKAEDANPLAILDFVQISR